MKFPSDQTIEAILSEMHNHQQQHHQEKIEGAECEFCALNKELEKRTQLQNNDEPCLLDKLPAQLAENIPPVMMMLMIGGSPMAFYTVLLCRFAFLLGMKAQKAQSEQGSLDDMMEKI